MPPPPPPPPSMVTLMGQCMLFTFHFSFSMGATHKNSVFPEDRLSKPSPFKAAWVVKWHFHKPGGLRPQEFPR